MLVALVDDSLVLVYNVREYELCDESITGTDCIDGGENDGLFLVNYREKSAPLWGDTTEGYLRLARGFYRDSSVFFQDDDGHFGFWRIGGSPRIAGSWINDSCSMANPLEARPWRNGDVLFVNSGSSDCPYAVLDTSTGEVRKLEFTGESAWLEGCDDITYRNGKTICLKPIFAEDHYGAYLLMDGTPVDSVVWNKASWQIKKTVLNFDGPLFTIDHPTQMNDGSSNPLSGKQVFTTNPLAAVEPSVWLDGSAFRYADSTEIQYFGYDLTVTGGEE